MRKLLRTERQRTAAKYGICSLVALLLILLQTTRGFSLRLFGGRADLLVCWLVCVAMYENPYFSGLLGFFCGLLLSINTPWPEGLDALLLALLGIGVSCACSTLMRRVLPTALIWGAGALALRLACAAFFHGYLAHGAALLPELGRLLVSLLLSLPFCPLFYLITQRLHRALSEVGHA